MKFLYRFNDMFNLGEQVQRNHRSRNL